MNEPARARGAGEVGTTLIEILITIVLIGVAFVALLAGLSTVILGSDIHKKQADAEVVLGSAAEHLKDPAVDHVPCALVTNADYVAAVRSATVPTGWDPATTIDITKIEYWDGTTYGTTCHDTDALGHFLTLQQVTIEVTAPDGRADETITAIKAPAQAAP